MLVVAALLAAAPGGARADEAAGSWGTPVGFEASLGTRFPLEFGIDVAAEAPYGLTAHLGLGWMPHVYRDLINDAAVGFDLYEDADAALVAAALEDAVLLSPTIGWRPPPLGGFEVYAGYVLTFLGGSVTRAEAEEISGEDLGGAGAGVAEVPLSGKAHGFQLGVAYQAALAPHLSLRLSLAYFQIVSASAGIDVEVQGAAAQRIVDRVEARLDERVDELLSSYVKAPLLGVSGVWRF
ncbi:MAG TPA: hypothetical protein VK698_17900 [Kofleriaceae bacterium]|nr:hypothetical protein [Kofleriaceae bacterium]